MQFSASGLPALYAIPGLISDLWSTCFPPTPNHPPLSDMLEGGHLSIIVGNAHKELLEWAATQRAAHAGEVSSWARRSRPNSSKAQFCMQAGSWCAAGGLSWSD